MPIFTWSQTASTNNTADPTINFAEGQAPSSLNDSCRSLMAAIAKWRDDNSGSLTLVGNPPTYTLTTNSVFTSLSVMSGQTIRFKVNLTTTANPTLNVDSLGSKPLVWATGVPILSGELTGGYVYSAVYDGTNGQWIVQAGNAGEIPSGTQMLFQQTTPPSGWTKQIAANDRALRVTSGSVTSGGTYSFSSIFVDRTIAVGNLPSYNLLVSDSVTTTTVQSGAGTTVLALGAPTAAGSPGASTVVSSNGSGVALPFAVQYVDVIIAAKN